MSAARTAVSFKHLPIGNRSLGALAGLLLAASAAVAQTPAPDATSPAPAQPEVTAPAQPAAPAEPSAAAPVETTPAETAPAQPTTAEAAPAEMTPAQAPAESAEPAEPMDVLTQFLNPEKRTDLPHDLSPWGMFMAADWVVKAVMIGLAFASLVTWTVWLAKSLELAGARTRASRTLKVIQSARSLAEAYRETDGRGGPAALMLRAAAQEIQMSEAALDHADGHGVKERVSSALLRIEASAGRRMSRGTGVLATIGSTAPFVGLLGTVWGIMNSFIGISETQTTNLAVVAPGIAEALLATAIGLVAAIPAVVIYNVFARSVTGYRQLLADAAAGVERLVSRDLDFRKVPPDARKTPVSLVSGG
ncbi:tonB-system energizer ExbB [Neorhizobium sp. SOG26]|uniref:tonB-system energizer ExbB n=1 Tax=Neorhizobium sp. SOG26 TaxID=2060726 RepID=UPI000E56CE6C|nr:tonB-system energizer ExbB [Neorhizobium sp. SOG26]AXV17012.1 tonB-system energizer ExbB [Neorhizobium sp. SOG26]